jgi:hypothetical protein
LLCRAFSALSAVALNLGLGPRLVCDGPLALKVRSWLCVVWIDRGL